jgi:hypothetical protein
MAVCALACAKSSAGEDDGSSSSGQVGGAGGSVTSVGGGGSGQGGFVATGGSGGGEPAPSVIYAHDNTTLYVGDPTVASLDLQPIGDFDCIGGSGQDSAMTDVAVNRDGEVWAISTGTVYRLDVSQGMAHCAQTISLNNPNDIRFYGLTFAPRGVLHPDNEVLIAGNSAGELWQIDPNGTLTQRGTFGPVPANDGNGNSLSYPGGPWELSGDIAFFENNGNAIGFATVRDCPNPPSSTGCNPVDTLLELDVPALANATTQSVTKSVRGMLVPASGCTDPVVGYGRAYGIAGYQGAILGFARDFGEGLTVTISNVDGTACKLDDFPGTSWAGAGITTVAPVMPPPPK